MGFKSKLSPHKYKKSRYAAVNVSKKDLLKIIREFENVPYKIHKKKRPKQDPTDIYFYLARQLEKCMNRADALNSHFYPVRIEIIVLSSHVYSTDEDESKVIIVHKTLSKSCSTDEDKSKGIIVNETLSQSCSTDEDESKGIIVNETLLQSFFTDEDELCFMEEEKSECTNTKQKY